MGERKKLKKKQAKKTKGIEERKKDKKTERKKE
jgi:hypothetical protein